MRDKIFRTFSFIAYLAVAAFSTNASAALVLDFSTGGAGFGGTITYDGTNVTGSDILIGDLTVGDAGDPNGTSYATDAVLNFDTVLLVMPAILMVLRTLLMRCLISTQLLIP